MDAIRASSNIETASAGAGARRAQRATIQLVMDTADLLSRVIDSDAVRGMIFLGIIAANTRHLRAGSPDAQAYAQTGTIVPDSARRGISVHALSHEVNMPYETARRHVQRLIKSGRIERVEDGVVVPDTVFADYDTQGLTAKNYTNVRRFLDQLRDIGVI